MANKEMFLFWGSGSAPCWKAMIVLAEKGLWEGCPNKLLEFSKQDHKKSDVLALNQRGQMPTFKDGEVVVNESSAVCMYLEEKYSNDGNRLLPSNVDDRSQVYQRMFEASNIQSNIILPIIVYQFRTKKEDQDMNLIKENTVKAKAELDRWNTILGDKNYICGNNFTMADVFVYPFLALLVRTGATLSGHGALKKYYDRVSVRPSVKATCPPHWKESDGPVLVTGL